MQQHFIESSAQLITFSLKTFSKHTTKLWLWYAHTSLLVVYTLQVRTLLLEAVEVQIKHDLCVPAV